MNAPAARQNVAAVEAMYQFVLWLDLLTVPRPPQPCAAS